MSAQDSMEHAEHAEHASSENKKIALLIAVIALFLALSETLGKGAQTQSIARNVEAANLWAFFQAKTIRRTVVQTAADQARLGLGAGDDTRQGRAAKADRGMAKIRRTLSFGTGNRRRYGATIRARQARRGTTRLRDREVSSLRARLRRLPDRDRARLGNDHHRHTGAGLGFGTAGSRRARLYGARHLCAPRTASVSIGRRLSAPRALSCGSAGPGEASAPTSHRPRRA